MAAWSTTCRSAGRIAAGCDRIYVLLCGPLHYHPPPPRRPLEAQLTAFFVAIHARFVRELALAPARRRGGRLQRGRRAVGPVPRLLGDGGPHRGGAGRGGRRARPLRRHVAGPGAGDRPGLVSAVTGERYLLSNDAPEAMDRFTAFTTLFDPATFRHLDGLGLAAGLALLGGGGGRDVGGGTTCPSGSARPGTCSPPTSTCRGPPRAAADAATHPTSKSWSTMWPPSPPRAGPFDLVHARLVLVHVPERDEALATMVATLRPGGVMLVEDADPALQPLSCLEEIGPAAGTGQSDPAGLPLTAGRTRRGPGLRAHAAAPAPGGRPGPGGAPTPPSR